MTLEQAVESLRELIRAGIGGRDGRCPYCGDRVGWHDGRWAEQHAAGCAFVAAMRLVDEHDATTAAILAGDFAGMGD